MSISYSPLKKTEPLQQILQRPDLWKGRNGPVSCSLGISTGYPELDKKLLRKGWPQNGLIEFQQQFFGHGEWHLLLPSMVSLLAEPGYIALISPPAVPYAPALIQRGIAPERVLVIEPLKKQDWLASVLEVLAANCCVTLCCWEPRQRLLHAELRKLQLASSQSGSLCFLLREKSNRAYSASPAVLKLKLQNSPAGLQVRIDKQRGSYEGGEVLLAWPSQLSSHQDFGFRKPETDRPDNILQFSGHS
jgi:protein ImuA